MKGSTDNDPDTSSGKEGRPPPIELFSGKQNGPPKEEGRRPEHAHMVYYQEYALISSHHSEHLKDKSDDVERPTHQPEGKVSLALLEIEVEISKGDNN
jgi:hypothetical protein